MKKTVIFALVVFCAVFIVAGVTMAVPKGKTLTFDKSPMGVVTFSGDIHDAAGAACADCHNAGMFPKMKQGTVSIKMTSIYSGKLCGECHNGKRAFAAQGNCGRCHKR